MSDFDSLVAKEEQAEVSNLYRGIISAIENQSGLEVIAESIKNFQNKLETLMNAASNTEDNSATLKQLIQLQKKIQTAQASTNTEIVGSLSQLLENFIQEHKSTQEKNNKEMSNMISTLTDQLTKQYDLLVDKMERDQEAVWEFTTQKVENEIIMKVRIERIK